MNTTEPSDEDLLRVYTEAKEVSGYDGWRALWRAGAARGWDEGHDAARTFYAGGPKEPNPYAEGSQ